MRDFDNSTDPRLSTNEAQRMMGNPPQRSSGGGIGSFINKKKGILFPGVGGALNVMQGKGFFSGEDLDQPMPGFEPEIPDYVPTWSPERASLPGVQTQLDQQKGFFQLQKEALAGPGASAWEQVARQEAALGGQTGMEKAAAQARSAQAEGLSGLARSGGIVGGARERLAQAGTAGRIGASQTAGRAALEAQLGVGKAAEANRQTQLQALPGAEAARSNLWSQARQFDLNQQIGESTRANQFNLERARDRNQARAAQMMAQAQSKPPPGLLGGSGFLGSGINIF